MPQSSTDPASAPAPQSDTNLPVPGTDLAEIHSAELDLEPIPATDTEPAHCQHIVTRKKRFCKMTVAKGKQYCGEHLPNTIESSHEDSYIPVDKRSKRIPCPLDSKHTVYAWNLTKHLKICNAKQPAVLPEYINIGINLGTKDVDATEEVESNITLSLVPSDVLRKLMDKVNQVFVEKVAPNMIELFLKHTSMDAEIAKEGYGPETRKHLIQTSSILGYLRDHNFLDESTSFVEFGAGKGHLSYWLAQLIKDKSDSNVVLVDRASHRHKQDNKIEERDVVKRIRADIADLDLRRLKACGEAKHVVGVSKHLCGAATDLAIRCLVNDGSHAETNDSCIPGRVKGLVIALCCHHRCEWRSYVGKAFLLENGIGRDEFLLIKRMVSWAVCGTGESRETRRAHLEKTQPTEDDQRPGKKISIIFFKKFFIFPSFNFQQASHYNLYLKNWRPTREN